MQHRFKNTSSWRCHAWQPFARTIVRGTGPMSTAARNYDASSNAGQLWALAWCRISRASVILAWWFFRVKFFIRFLVIINVTMHVFKKWVCVKALHCNLRSVLALQHERECFLFHRGPCGPCDSDSTDSRYSEIDCVPCNIARGKQAPKPSRRTQWQDL